MTPRVEQLIAAIESLGKVFTWYAPATEASIAALEQAFGVRLPPSYRAFLARYGGGGIRAWKGISGIWDNDPLTPNLGTAYGDTMRMRAERGMPDHLIVIARRRTFPADVPRHLTTRAGGRIPHRRVLLDVAEDLDRLLRQLHGVL